MSLGTIDHNAAARLLTINTSKIPVFKKDGTLAPMEKLEAHRKGVKHLAISSFVFCGEELLVQRRAAGKYHCPLLWANSCCTHPHWNEDPQVAAERRLREELGFTLPLTKMGETEYRAEVGNGLIEHEYVHMFFAEADKNALEILPNPEEVAEVQWVTPRRLARMIADAPDCFTPWIQIYLQRWPSLRMG